MRKAYFFLVMAIVLLALLLVPLIAGMARAESSQTWFLTKNPVIDLEFVPPNEGSVHSCDNIMEIDGSCGQFDEDSYPIGSAMVAWWYSEPAECDVTFGEGDDWVVYLCILDCDGSGVLQAQLWSVNGDGIMESLLAQGQKAYDSDDGNEWCYQTVEIECDGATSQTVPEDSRLGLRVSSSALLALYTCSGYCSSSRLCSPESDPGFPVPELPAIILLAGGLGCLAGYMAWRRLRANASATNVQRK